MRLQFRADIEGLRAIAVLLVVCAHARVPWLKGGFVGVDVFFVLSGFLISGLLLHELQATGRIALKSFYARRLQRLLPTLLLVIVATSISGFVLLAPFEQLSQTGAAMAAATWTSNFYFAFSDLDYFGPAAESNLFLHTWSLGVEEQFYLLWPALLLVLSAGRWKRTKSNTLLRIKRGMGLFLLGSLSFSILLTYVAPQLGFYMVMSRAWQFALGALAFFYSESWRGRIPRSVSMYVGWLGLASILVAATLLDQHVRYPGFWALLPSIGTAALLVCGAASHHVGSASKILSIRPLQAIGRVSYSWYLWHWPVLLLGATILDTGEPLNVTAIVLLSLGLAGVTYWAFESPLRHARAIRSHPNATLLGGVCIMFGCILVGRGWATFAGHWVQAFDQKMAAVRLDKPAVYSMKCHTSIDSTEVRVCNFGDPLAPNTVVLMGDSVAAQWSPAVIKYFRRKHWRVVILTKSACPMVNVPRTHPRLRRPYVECGTWRDAAIEEVRKIEPNVILLSSSAKNEYSGEEWTRGTSQVLDRLPTSSRIAILLPTPVLPFDASACVARMHWRRQIDSSNCTAPSRTIRLETIHGAIAEAARIHPNVRTVDMVDSVCPGGVCTVGGAGAPTFRDDGHITASFAATLATSLASALETAGVGVVASTSERSLQGSAPTSPEYLQLHPR